MIKPISIALRKRLNKALRDMKAGKFADPKAMARLLVYDLPGKETYTAGKYRLTRVKS